MPAQNFEEIHPPFLPQEALVEANRCLFCFDAPCAIACPTHIDVPRFIKKIATGNLPGSAAAILEANVLGLSCSRVCPVEVLCEGSCVLHQYNRQPIEIGRLQRHAMDFFYDHGGRLPAPPADNGKKVACIGGGPASLSCAAELRAHGFAVTIFDKRELGGGLNTYGVAEYKFTPLDSRKEVELIRSLGVSFQHGIEVGSGVSIEDLESAYDAVFLGIGLGPTQPLGIDGENLPGVTTALRFIADYKMGAPVKVGRRVAVIGGGNTAIDAAIAARRLGAEEVYILYRRGEKEMSAFAFEFDHAKREEVKFVWHAQPTAIVGNGAVGAVEFGPGLRVACDMAVVAIGQSRLLDLLEACRGVEWSKGNVAIHPETGQTSNPKYFAGGDCVNGGREVVDAVADGKRAARGIVKWLT